MERRWLILSVALIMGCTQTSRVETEVEVPIKTDTSFERLPRVLSGIPKSGDVLLREGLPSEFWEPALREQELNRNKTIKIHGYPFYEETIALQGADAEPLTALLSSRNSFKRYDSKKRCGGYDPEYCLEWKAGEEATHALVCLACREIKLFGPKGELYCDLSPEAAQKLEQVLKPHQKHRPATTSSQ